MSLLGVAPGPLSQGSFKQGRPTLPLLMMGGGKDLLTTSHPHLYRPQQEAQKIFKANHPMDPEVTKAKVRGGGWWARVLSLL